MNRRQKIIVSVTGIFLVLLLLVGLTYAYFLTQVTGNTNNKSISVSTANLALVYGDGNGVIVGDNIMPDTTLDEKTFSIKNTGNATTKYTIVFDNVENDFINESDLRYELVNKTTGETTSGFIRNFLIEGYQTQKILANVDIEEDAIHNYGLKVSFIDSGKDQSIDMKKTLSLKVDIIGEIDNPRMVLAENIYQNYVISQKQNNNIVDETLATTYLKQTLTTAGFDATDAMVYENRAVVGSFAKAINAGAEIGDCINYDSPNMNEKICDWRILGVSENGELEAVTKVTSDVNSKTSCVLHEEYTLTYADGYVNAEEDLAKCAEPFADGNIGLTSRSINVEDVNRVTGYSPMNVGIKAPYNVGTYYEEGTLREYLNKITFLFKGHSSGYILYVKTSNGIEKSLVTPTFYPLNEDKFIYNGDRTEEYVRDYYSYYPTTLTKTNDETASLGLSTSSKAYAMLFENTDLRHYEYWLANKYIDIKESGDSLKMPTIHWGIRLVSGKRVTGTAFWDSNYGLVYKQGNNGNVKPVVNISNNINITKGTTDSSTGLTTYNIVTS